RATSPGAPSARPIPASGLASAPTAPSNGSGIPPAWKIRSAVASASLARRASRPGSPGPAPTNGIRPADFRLRVMSLLHLCFLVGRGAGAAPVAHPGQHRPDAGLQQLDGELPPQLLGQRNPYNGTARPDDAPPIRIGRRPVKAEFAALAARRQCGDRPPTASLQRRHERPFG